MGKSKDLDWQMIDGQMQKVISIQARRRDYLNLRRIGYKANGSFWDVLARRIAAWLA